MSTDKIAVAVRVLKAYSTRLYPEERDVMLLRSYCPDYPALDPDDLARIAIRESIQHRRTTPTMYAGGNAPV